MIHNRKRKTINYKISEMLGKPQKIVLILVAGTLRGGGELNGGTTKEKRTFFNVRKKVLSSFFLSGTPV